MRDTIYRQAAIDAVNEYLRLSEMSKTVEDMTSIQEILERLPPAQQWIPCSERVPQKGELCIVWFKPYGGSEEAREWGIGYCIPLTGGLWSVQGSPRAEVIAWMLLPEPYKEEEEHG